MTIYPSRFAIAMLGALLPGQYTDIALRDNLCRMDETSVLLAVAHFPHVLNYYRILRVMLGFRDTDSEYILQC
jgi:hypothetical protein